MKSCLSMLEILIYIDEQDIQDKKNEILSILFIHV